MMRSLRRVHSREDGTSLVEFSWIALILLVPLVFVVSAVFQVQAAAYGVTAATRAGTRAYTLSPDPGTGEARAWAAAQQAMADQGWSLNDSRVEYKGIRCVDGCLEPGSAAELTIEANVPLPFLPGWMTGGANLAIPVSSTHRTPYGEYRQSRS